MFYSVELLKLRKKGRIPRCWLAATLNKSLFKKYVKKHEVEQTDIILACQDTIEMMQSEDPSKKISLYLSAQLSYGVLIVYKYQVDTLYRECTNLLQETIFGSDHSSSGGSKAQKTGKKPKDSKSKNKELFKEPAVPDIVIPDINIDLEKVLNVSGVQDKNLLPEIDNYQVPINFETPTFGALTTDEVLMFMADTDISTVRHREPATMESVHLSIDHLAAYKTIPQPEMIEQSIAQAIPQELFPETPTKRKSRKSDAETPSKRQRLETRLIELPEVSVEMTYTSAAITKYRQDISRVPKFGEISPSSSSLPLERANLPVWAKHTVNQATEMSITPLPVIEPRFHAVESEILPEHPARESGIAPQFHPTEAESVPQFHPTEAESVPQFHIPESEPVAAMPECDTGVGISKDILIPMEIDMEEELPLTIKEKRKNKGKSRRKIADRFTELDHKVMKSRIQNIEIDTVTAAARRVNLYSLLPPVEEYFTVPSTCKLRKYFVNGRRKWAMCLIDEVNFEHLFENPLVKENDELREFLDSINDDTHDPIRDVDSRTTKSSKMSSVGFRGKSSATSDHTSKSETTSDHAVPIEDVSKIPSRSPPRNEITDELPSPPRPMILFEEPSYEPLDTLEENKKPLTSEQSIKDQKEKLSKKQNVASILKMSQVEEEEPEESPDYIANIPLARKTSPLNKIPLVPETLPLIETDECNRREESPEEQYIFTKHDFLAEIAGYFHRYKRDLTLREILPNSQYKRAEVTHCLNLSIALHVDEKLEIYQDNPQDTDIHLRQYRATKND